MLVRVRLRSSVVVVVVVEKEMRLCSAQVPSTEYPNSKWSLKCDTIIEYLYEPRVPG